MFHHALEVAFLYGIMKFQFSVFIAFQIAQIVVTASPYLPILITIQGCDTCDAGRMNDAPFCIVVIEQSFEVCHIDKALVIGGDIEVTVMSLIFVGSEVAQERKALC